LTHALHSDAYRVHRRHPEQIDGQAGELEVLVAVLLLEAARKQARDNATV